MASHAFSPAEGNQDGRSDGMTKSVQCRQQTPEDRLPDLVLVDLDAGTESFSAVANVPVVYITSKSERQETDW